MSFDPAALTQRLPHFRSAGEPQRLSGGLLNYVWRVRGTATSDPRSVIVKWAPPYIASSPDVALDANRMLVEARAMVAFEPGGSLAPVGSAGARPPSSLLVDEQRHALVMEDVGQWPDLGLWLRDPAHAQPDCEAVGAALGRFIGALHLISAGRPELMKEFDNPSIQRTRFEVQYAKIQHYADRAGLPGAEELGRRAIGLGLRLQQPGICVIMGDLWPPSVLVTDGGLRIIDWELAHYGRPAQDLGHLEAHLWMHIHRAPDAGAAGRIRALHKRFQEAYRSTLGSTFDQLVGAEGVRESSVHFGCEVLARTVGAFQAGYLYDGLAPHDPLIQDAARVARLHILSPSVVNTFDVLR
jgi:aminoglycoside phosphotransferase (APT) family kinase protein